MRRKTAQFEGNQVRNLRSPLPPVGRSAGAGTLSSLSAGPLASGGLDVPWISMAEQEEMGPSHSRKDLS